MNKKTLLLIMIILVFCFSLCSCADALEQPGGVEIGKPQPIEPDIKDTPTENAEIQVNLPTPHNPPTSYRLQAPTNPEEQAIIDAARKYAASIYGEEYISKFSYSKMLINEAIKTADVFFYIRYKERIFTECCIVTLYESKPASSNVLVSGKGIDADFDPTLLNGVEIDELEQFADQKVKEKYGESYHSYEIENDIVVVRNNSGGFDLCVIANIQTQPDHEPIREKYYYPLS